MISGEHRISIFANHDGGDIIISGGHISIELRSYGLKYIAALYSRRGTSYRIALEIFTAVRYNHQRTTQSLHDYFNSTPKKNANKSTLDGIIRHNGSSNHTLAPGQYSSGPAPELLQSVQINDRRS